MIWISAHVGIRENNEMQLRSMMIALHMEERYNFNPGAKDIATGTPDDANGVFELTGRSHEFSTRRRPGREGL